MIKIDKKIIAWKVKENQSKEINNNACPQCKSEMTNNGGCWTCLQCGFSKCDI